MSQVKDVNDDNFEAEVTRSEVPVLADFTAAWCGPCKKLAPLVEEIAGEYAGRLKVVKVDVDKARTVAAKFGVMSVPTLILFNGGKVKDQVTGLVPKRAIVDRVEKVL
jgi:thioredoxin 1